MKNGTLYAVVDGVIIELREINGKQWVPTGPNASRVHLV